MPLRRVLRLTMATQHLQGLVPRKTATADPKTPAEFFNHVAENVRVNEDLTALRCVRPSDYCAVICCLWSADTCC